MCVCVCAHDRRGREKSWDGLLYHAYLKGHSVIVGLHFTEPGCGQREANWSWRSRGRLREIGLGLKCCTGLKRMYKSWHRKEDESAMSSKYLDLQQDCFIEIAFVTPLCLFGVSYFMLFQCICLLMSHLWKCSDFITSLYPCIACSPSTSTLFIFQHSGGTLNCNGGWQKCTAPFPLIYTTHLHWCKFNKK